MNLMVPYPAGGLSDAIARIVERPLGKALNQMVITENLGGVGSCMVHNPAYDFNDDNIATGSAYWVLLTRRFLKEPAS